VTVIDDAETLEVARENCARAGLQDRILLEPGDAFTDDLGTGYELVFLSNLLHIYSAAENRLLISRAAAAVAPTGRICIKDFLLDPTRTSPRGAALFSVNMLVSTTSGDCYTLQEIEGWLGKAGFFVEETLNLARYSRLVLGKRR
jgi:predicted O-methyltransferase YrrM